MTTENIDVDFIKASGNIILEETPIHTVLTLLYGIFFLLFCISTVIFMRRGFTTRTQWMMLIISVICFALFTLFWALEVMTLVIFVKSVLVDNITLPEVYNYELYETKTASIRTTQEVIGELLPIISDTMVVWRAWVIFPSHRRWMIGPVVLLFCTLVITVIHLLSFFECVPALINHDRVVDGVFAGEIAVSMVTNLVTTLLISYNLWDHRMHVSGNLGHQRSQSQGEKILAVLVESGAVYCMIQVVTLVLLITRILRSVEYPMKANHALEIFLIIYTGTSAMYPVIVVMLVRLQLSFEHTYGFSLVSQAQELEYKNTSRLPTIGQLKFAPASSNEFISGENGEILQDSRDKEFNV